MLLTIRLNWTCRKNLQEDDETCSKRISDKVSHNQMIRSRGRMVLGYRGSRKLHRIPNQLCTKIIEPVNES